MQRTLSVNGNRCVGDAFQDFLLSRKIVFGTGSDVIVPYIYFSLRTGKGARRAAVRWSSPATWRCSRFPGHLCLRRQGHRHPCGVQLHHCSRRLIFPRIFPRPPGTGFLCRENSSLRGAAPGHGPTKGARKWLFVDRNSTFSVLNANDMDRFEDANERMQQAGRAEEERFNRGVACVWATICVHRRASRDGLH